MVSQNIENGVDSMKSLWMYIYCGCIFTVQFFCIRRLVLLSCYIFVRDALYHFYSCKIYWMNLFTYCTSCLHVLPIAPVTFKLAVGNFKKKNGWNKSPVQIPESDSFLSSASSDLRRRYHRLRYNPWGSFPVLGSFAVQFGDHLRY